MNDLLSQWAESRHMPPERAEAIRLRVVDAAPSLDCAWWRGLFEPLRQGVRLAPPVSPYRPGWR